MFRETENIPYVLGREEWKLHNCVLFETVQIGDYEDDTMRTSVTSRFDDSDSVLSQLSRDTF